jgi:hypothetical protein
VPRAGWVKPLTDQRLSDHIAIGVLTATFPPALVDEVLAATRRVQQRSRLLPARLVTYYVLALALFSSLGYEEVMRTLVEGLSWQSGWRQAWRIPSQPALTQARARLGEEPLAQLFARACVPLAPQGSGQGDAASFWRGLRVVAVDGTTFDVPDTPDNDAAFGRPASGRGTGKGAYPQLRAVALAECGTHAIFAAALGPYATAETALARELVGRLEPGMLVLADRLFLSHPLFSAFAAGGAQLCWRAKANALLPVLVRHPDGSYASELVASDDKTTRERVIPVRVIEYRIDDPGRPQAEATTYRLVTTLLDPDAAPAAELAALYGQRWEFESALAELKTHQRGPGVVLRSKSAEGVRQEVWAYLCTHYAIRALMAGAAQDRGVDPDRLSFTATLAAARRSVRAGLGSAATTLAVGVRSVVAEIGGVLVRARQRRAAPRVVKRKMSNYHVKRPEHRGWPQPTVSIETAIAVLGAVGS